MEAENSAQRATIKTLRLETARLRAIQQADAQDLIHLAGRLLALSRATGVDVDTTTKELVRRCGWTTATRQTETEQR